MRTDLLLKLADHLDSIAETEMDMSNFINRWCGTPACVFGHYVHTDIHGGAFKVEQISATDTYEVVTEHGSPVYYRHIAEHFDVDEEEAVELFGENGCGYRGVERFPAWQAASYIRWFVSERVPPEAA